MTSKPVQQFEESDTAGPFMPSSIAMWLAAACGGYSKAAHGSTAATPFCRKCSSGPSVIVPNPLTDVPNDIKISDARVEESVIRESSMAKRVAATANGEK